MRSSSSRASSARAVGYSGFGVVADVDPNRVVERRLPHDLLDQLAVEDVGDEPAPLPAELGEVRLAARSTGHGRPVGRTVVAGLDGRVALAHALHRRVVQGVEAT